MVDPLVLRLFFGHLHLTVILEVVAFANTPSYSRICEDRGRKGVDQPESWSPAELIHSRASPSG